MLRFSFFLLLVLSCSELFAQACLLESKDKYFPNKSCAENKSLNQEFFINEFCKLSADEETSLTYVNSCDDDYLASCYMDLKEVSGALTLYVYTEALLDQYKMMCTDEDNPTMTTKWIDPSSGAGGRERLQTTDELTHSVLSAVDEMVGVGVYDDLAFNVLDAADEVVSVYDNYYDGNQIDENTPISQPAFKLVNSRLQSFLDTIELNKQKIFARASGEKLSECKTSFQGFNEGTLKLLQDILVDKQSVYKGYTNGLIDHVYAVAQDFAVHTISNCR